MSILKGILHHWNKTNKNYDTIHPETESAQVTDWHQAVIGSLASKVLPAVVSDLTTDSVMGKLMKMLLNASGVKYNIGKNGYICFGSFLGGLIIQWGIINNTSSPHDYALPLSMSAAFAAVANDVGGDCHSIGIQPHASTVTIASRKTNDLSYASTVLYYIVMGV